ncbi:anti-sigma factor family protein [Gloeobacter morelensis]|uniref:Putative zinc-finger domain-containing protein n=1 Tax=Gloeobacter morelensis MG652769 TaxID=2781736 RepID=A0ABY3PJV7_9CYAN|nr:hypothetical protein [Gloeobacter morelensis]UFP93864.1 hypothetical protein ISF26_19140 [Gloeobacter morelensis MG652769]
MDPHRFEQLSAYLDGELSTAEQQQIEQWLQADPAARKLYEDLLKLQRSSRALAAPALPPRLSDRVFDRLETRRRWLGGSLTTAAALLFAVVGYWWQSPDREPILTADSDIPGIAVARQPAPPLMEVAARSYLLEDRAPEDAYAILLEREEILLPNDH